MRRLEDLGMRPLGTDNVKSNVSDIAELEKTLDAKLPKEYVLFLNQVNGGAPKL